MPSKRTKGPEALTQDLICDYLTAKRVWWMRMNTGATLAEHKGKTRVIRYGRKGCADLLVIDREDEQLPLMRVIWIETKHRTKQSEHQKMFQEEVESEGHVYIVARSLEDVLEVVK